MKQKLQQHLLERVGVDDGLAKSPLQERAPAPKSVAETTASPATGRKGLLTQTQTLMFDQSPTLEVSPQALAPGFQEAGDGLQGPAREQDPGSQWVPPALSERVLSSLFDAVIHVAVLAGGVLGMTSLGLQPALDQWPGFAGFLACFSFLYTTVPLAFWGQTPGMAWRGLRARGRYHRQISFGQTGIRWLALVLTLVGFGLPLVFVLWGPSFADRLSGSRTRQKVR